MKSNFQVSDHHSEISSGKVEINGAKTDSHICKNDSSELSCVINKECKSQNKSERVKKKSEPVEISLKNGRAKSPSSLSLPVVKVARLSDPLLEKFLKPNERKSIEINSIQNDRDLCGENSSTSNSNSFGAVKTTDSKASHMQSTKTTYKNISAVTNVITSSTCLPVSLGETTKSISSNSKSIASSNKEKLDDTLIVSTRLKNVRKTYFNKSHKNESNEKLPLVISATKDDRNKISSSSSNTGVSSDIAIQANIVGDNTIESENSRSRCLSKPQICEDAIDSTVTNVKQLPPVDVNAVPASSNNRVFKPPANVETLIHEINKKEDDEYYSYLQSLQTPPVQLKNFRETMCKQTELAARDTEKEAKASLIKYNSNRTECLRQHWAGRPPRSYSFSLLRQVLNKQRNSLLKEQALSRLRSALENQDTVRVISSFKDDSVLNDDCFCESTGKNSHNTLVREYSPKCSNKKTEVPQDRIDKTVQKKTKATQTVVCKFNQRKIYRRMKNSYKRRLKHNSLHSNSVKICETKDGDNPFKSSSDERSSNCKSITSRVDIDDAHKSLPEYNLRKRKRLTEVSCKQYNGSYKTYNKVCLNCSPVKVTKKRLVRKKSENDSNSRAPKRVQKYQLSPLQDINPRIPTTDVTIKKQDKKLDDDKSESQTEPVSERLCHSLNSKSVLSSVLGLKTLDMIQPGNVNHIVNVVQISGGRSTSTSTSQNSQTSTQVSPHIQRVGQPRVDKPEQLNNVDVSTTITSSSITNSTTSKPSTSQPSAVINILSQQIIRPTQSNSVRNRPSPLINILSQQIIKPANNQNTQKQPVNSTQSQETLVNNVPKTVTTSEQYGASTANSTKNSVSTVKSVVTTASSGQGTILQLICKSTLPKFQQAFGKSYQNSTDSTEASGTTGGTPPTTSVDTTKKPQVKNSSVNIQPIHGGVIYTRQMPVGQTINLLPPGRGQVFRIATSNPDQISLVKDTVIHSKMSALLAAALQGKQKSSDTNLDGDVSNEESNTRVAVTARPALLQNTRIVKPVLQIPSNVIRTSPQSNLSSTTLEQLREFDMVYKQIKERSSTGTPSESNASNDSTEAPQRISVTYVNQGQKYTPLSPVVVVSTYCNLQPSASPALSVTSQGSSSPCVTPAPTPNMPKVSSKNSKGKTVKNTTTHTSKTSPIPKPQQKPQEDEHTTQRIFDILAEYAEQLRNSPDLNNKPAPRRRSNPPTNPSQNSKRKKSSSSKKTGQCSSVVSDIDLEDHRTVGSEDSSCGVVQLSVPEEEQQLQTTTESNDSNSSSHQQLILTEAGGSQARNLIIAEPTVGEALKMPNTAVLVPGNYIMPVSMVKGGQQIAVVSGGSKILATVPARSGPNMLLFQSFLNQNKKTGIPTVKYSTIQPISGVSSQNISNVNAQPPVILPPNSHSLTAVTLGQPITLKKVEESDRVNTELLLTISQPRDSCNSTSENQQPDSSSSTSNADNVDLEETVVQSEQTFQKSIINTPIATPVIAQTACNKEDVCTKNEHSGSQAGTLITLNLSENKNKDENVKSGERVQSVLVTACTSNGPMLSHTPPRYRKPENTGLNHASNKEEFMHNGEKQSNESKQFQSSAPSYYPKVRKSAPPQKLEREILQLSLQRKQAALERELRLQKSLSEECEDLGVDEPSTSDLFPEADLLFDSNHSPSFDQCSQDLVKKAQYKEEPSKASMTLFSDEDDDNSGSLRADFLFEPVEYQPHDAALEYGRQQQQQQQQPQQQQITNGQSGSSTESGSSCEDSTLLQNCASMSDVTLNSPISCEYDSSAMHKYKFKYSNRKKGERAKQNIQETWTAEVSSSEDTIGSTELTKSSEFQGHTASCDEELSDSSYKVVHVAISKGDLLKDDESCEELHCDEMECLSGRGARRSVKKQCSCCNGQDGAARKRPASRPQTPAMHKKAFINKKR